MDKKGVLGKRRQESHAAEVVDGGIVAGFRKHPKNEVSQRYENALLEYNST